VQGLVDQFIAIALLSLRFAPALAFAPPFTLLRIPVTIRAMLAIALAAWAAASNPGASWDSGFRALGLPVVAATELFLGLCLALPLQLAFGMIAFMGRALDIQAGFGLSLLIDPTTRNQAPLIGTVFAYAAGAVFFLSDAPAELFMMIARSLELVPLGLAGLPERVTPLTGYLSAVTLVALGLIGILIMALLIVDLTVAAISKTVPQINALLIGFQVKALVTLLLLPLTLALAASTFARLLRMAIDATYVTLG
jgi:flagellar biosynthetic protein FliR